MKKKQQSDSKSPKAEVVPFNSYIMDGQLRMPVSLMDYPGNEDVLDSLIVNGREGEFRLYDLNEETGELRLPRSQKLRVPPMLFFDDYMSDGRFVSLPSAFKPREGQEEAIQSCIENLRETNGSLLIAKCGCGKALRNGEPVATPHGFVPIESLSVGDYVLSTNGIPSVVKGVFPQGIRPIYRITFSDGTHVDCDESHEWTLIKRRAQGSPIVTITTSVLLEEPLRKTSGRQFWLPSITPFNALPTEPMPVDPYLMGVLLGDACLSEATGISLCTPDKEILGYLQIPAPNRVSYMSGCDSGKAKTYRISPSVTDGQSDYSMKRIFRKLGLLGKKGPDKFIPSIYENGTIATKISLLQGLFDTDGYASNGNAIEYSTTSFNMAYSVKNIVESLGGICKVVERKTRYTKKDGTRSRYFDSYRAHVYLPRDICPFRLSRKKDAYLKTGHQRTIGRAVESVVYIGNFEATCISVSSNDKLFLTRGYIPTHNTVMGAEIALRMQVSTCVLVHKEFLAKQWEEAFKMLSPDIRIGRMQRDVVDTGRTHDVVIAVTQSVVNPKRDYPQEFFDSFGLVICDEVHRYAASLWQGAITRFPAKYRLGLTATPDRSDGLWPVVSKHISPRGPVVQAESLKPDVYIRKLSTDVPQELWFRPWLEQKMQRGLAITTLSGYIPRNEKIISLVYQAYSKGRKILVISERRDQLDYFSKRLHEVGLSDEDIGFYVGGIKQAKLDIAAEKQIILTTYQMAKEGLNIPDLDTLFFATPQSDIEQSTGRILRACDEKKSPMVVDFIDPEFKALFKNGENEDGSPKIDVFAPFEAGAHNRMRQYKKLGYTVHT